jgi:hypothetical protein
MAVSVTIIFTSIILFSLIVSANRQKHVIFLQCSQWAFQHWVIMFISLQPVSGIVLHGPPHHFAFTLVWLPQSLRLASLSSECDCNFVYCCISTSPCYTASFCRPFPSVLTFICTILFFSIFDDGGSEKRQDVVFDLAFEFYFFPINWFAFVFSLSFLESLNGKYHPEF